VNRAGSGTLPLPVAPPTSGAAPRTARIAVLGASGYSGQEFVRLALAHSGLELVALMSREHCGQPAAAALPGLDARNGSLPAFTDPGALPERIAAGEIDTVVACLPHGAWRERLERDPGLKDAPIRILDLSSDFRDGAAGFLYGLPEVDRESLSGATRVANPGCYATAGTLAMLPALERRWVEDPVMMSALSGVSGAGRAAQLRTSFVELDGGASAYGAGTSHPHVAEMSRAFERVSGARRAIGFTPQLVPMARGILLTASAPLARPVSETEARAAYGERFADEPFVRVLEAGVWPETRAVRASNRCDVAVTTLHGGRTLLAVAALDNLVKGAAGQAIQNLNLMLGWPETHGLPPNGSPW